MASELNFCLFLVLALICGPSLVSASGGIDLSGIVGGVGGADKLCILGLCPSTTPPPITTTTITGTPTLTPTSTITVPTTTIPPTITTVLPTTTVTTVLPPTGTPTTITTTTTGPTQTGPVSPTTTTVTSPTVTTTVTVPAARSLNDEVAENGARSRKRTTFLKKTRRVLTPRRHRLLRSAKVPKRVAKRNRRFRSKTMSLKRGGGRGRGRKGRGRGRGRGRHGRRGAKGLRSHRQLRG